jgi:hypothetical protein
MAKAVSAIELAKEVSANPGTFRYYLRKNWGERHKYQRWLFTRAQANKIKAAYLTSTRYGVKRHKISTFKDTRQLVLNLQDNKKPM